MTPSDTPVSEYPNKVSDDRLLLQCIKRSRGAQCRKRSFTAVDHVSFEVRRGEIFGLLGPNGAGKTTTFRMLCGLLPASGGTLRVAGVDLRYARASARQNIGYVAQKFSLYGQLSVTENLEFFASAYGLRGARKQHARCCGRSTHAPPLDRITHAKITHAKTATICQRGPA